MKRVVSIILAIMIMVPTIGMANPIGGRLPTMESDFIDDVLRMIEAKYPFKYDEEEILQGAVKGMLQTLDPNSDYYTREESEGIMELTQGQIVGIGVVMEYKDGYVQIKEVLEGNPADQAGLKAGDIILAVDDENMAGKTMSEISKRIKGLPDTKVKIQVNRSEEILDYQVERKNIKINPVSSKILNENLKKDIGYIRIDEFSNGAAKNLKTVLDDLDGKNIDRIILDLRNNPGGLLSEAIMVSNQLIPAGEIVHIRDKKGIDTKYATGFKNKKYEIVVLVNEYSASASEIVAGAIQDRKFGVLVGGRTYGKATVQSLMPVTDGSVVKLTIAEYLTPKKVSINEVGIEPDYKVENTLNEDLQLKKAIELLNK